MATRRGSTRTQVPQPVSTGTISGYQGTVDTVEADIKPPSTSEVALQGLLQLGSKVAEEKFNQDVKKAYVQGQLARQQGVAKEAMDVDPLMSPFAKGGYNDQDYRIKAVEVEQDFDRWLRTEGRALDPDDPKVKEQMAKANATVMESINGGMTGNAQIAAISNQVEANAARVTKHYTEHKKYVLEEYSRRVTPQGNQIITELGNSMLSGDNATYDALSRQAISYYQGIQNSNEVPLALRQDIGNKFVQALLAADQRQPVETMLQAGMLDTMPLDTREKITNAIRESENRTRNQEFAGKVEAFARIEEAGTTGEISIEDFADHIERAVASKEYTPARGIALLREAIDKGVGDRQQSQKLLNAINQRIIDGPDGVYALAGNPEKALTKVDTLLRANKMPTPERIAIITSAGLDFGAIPKQHGEAIGHALRAIGSAKGTDTIAPEHTLTLNSVLAVVDTASKAQPAKAGVLLNALPEDVRGAMTYVMEQASNGIAPVDSLQQYWATTDAVKNQTPAQRARITKKWWDEHKDSITSSSGFNVGLFGDYISSDSYTETTLKDNLWAELRRLDDNPAYYGASEEGKVKVATAHVMARTIPVPIEPGSGTVRPVVVDGTVNMQSTFGTDAKAVGQVLGDMVLPAKEGNTTFVRWDRVNKAFVQSEVTPEGQSFITNTITPAQVRASLEAKQAAQFEESQKELFGEPVQTSAGTIRIDGRNGQGEIRSIVKDARFLINDAAPDKVAGIVQSNPATAQQVLREDTDVAIAATERFIAPHYSFRGAKSAVIAAAYVEGTNKMQQVIEAADAAIAANDLEAYNEALSLVDNEKIREQLRSTLPIANLENQRATEDNVNVWRGLTK